MENFYKITKEQAQQIGKFSEAGYTFDPFVGEQKDGTYLVSEKLYEVLKGSDNLKKVDFSKLEKISGNKIDLQATIFANDK